MKAQLTYSVNNGAANVTGYTGSGDVVIPSTINIGTILNPHYLPVVSIGSAAFYGKTITSVTIADSITNIGTNVFAGCTHLAMVTIPDSISNIADTTFYNCISLTNMIIPDSVASIGGSAFYKCSGLTSVTIPGGVTNIGDWVFGYCSGLTNVTILTGVPSIGYADFAFCPKLMNVTIPNSVMIIGGGAFAQCPNLTSVTIPISVTNFGDGVFFGSSSLHQAFFQGSAPSVNGGPGSADTSVFGGDSAGAVYYLPGSTGWGTTFGGWPTTLWNPQMQTGNGSFGVQNNQFGFNITGSSNLVIVVEAATNLANPEWSPVSTNTLNTFAGTNGSSYFSDPQWTNFPNRFYRFRSP